LQIGTTGQKDCLKVNAKILGSCLRQNEILYDDARGVVTQPKPASVTGDEAARVVTV